MRIVFLSHYFPPEGNAPATRVYEMAKHWVRAGDQVTVITCAPNVPAGGVYPGHRNRLFERENRDGIEVIRVWTYIAPNRGTVRRIANYLSYLVSAVIAGVLVTRPDVVVATSPQFFCGWAGVILSALRRLPFVLEVRDLWPASILAVEAIRSRPIIAFLERLERRMYAAADHIVTVGEGYRREILARGVPAEKVSVVPNGIDREVLWPRAPDPALRKSLELGDAFVCAYVGTIGMAADLEVVLRAARLLRSRTRKTVRFLLVGDGAARDVLEARARAEGLDEIVFTGRLDKAEVPALLASVDACLVHLRPSALFATVLPSKLFEAAALARPVLLGVEGEAARLLEASRGGICFEPGNADQLAAALLRLTADPELGIRLGRSGHEYFVEHFDRRGLALRCRELLRRVAACDANETRRRDARDSPAISAGPAPEPAWMSGSLPRQTRREVT